MKKRDQSNSIREQVSFKQHEKYILDIRDKLLVHYRLNKSDLVKYLIQKEDLMIKSKEGVLIR